MNNGSIIRFRPWWHPANLGTILIWGPFHAAGFNLAWHISLDNNIVDALTSAHQHWYKAAHAIKKDYLPRTCQRAHGLSKTCLYVIKFDMMRFNEKTTLHVPPFQPYGCPLSCLKDEDSILTTYVSA